MIPSLQFKSIQNNSYDWHSPPSKIHGKKESCMNTLLNIWVQLVINTWHIIMDMNIYHVTMSQLQECTRMELYSHLHDCCHMSLTVLMHCCSPSPLLMVAFFHYILIYNPSFTVYNYIYEFYNLSICTSLISECQFTSNKGHWANLSHIYPDLLSINLSPSGSSILWMMPARWRRKLVLGQVVCWSNLSDKTVVRRIWRRGRRCLQLSLTWKRPMTRCGGQICGRCWRSMD